MTLLDFADIAQEHDEATDSENLFEAFRVLAELQKAVLDDDFAAFPSDDNYFPDFRATQRANLKAYERGVIILSALAIIANNPVYTLATPDNEVLMEETEQAGQCFHTYYAFVSLEAAKAYIEEMKMGGGEDMAELINSLKIFRVPFMALSYLGISLYEEEKPESLEPLYMVGELVEKDKLGFYMVPGRFYHNMFLAMALGAVDVDASATVLNRCEDFVPERLKVINKDGSKYYKCNPYPNAKEEAEVMSVLKRGLCGEEECLVEDDADIDWNDIAALLAEEQS